MIVKICGMREPENIRAVAATRPDWMGFIFYPGSPRYVGPGFEIPANVQPSIKRVGVFVNESLDKVLETVNQHHLDLVQLHGDEPEAYCAALKSQGLRLIKVFRVDAHFDFSATEVFLPVADYFLFDTKGVHYGGNARPFDWTLLEKYKGPVPFLLSGGLTPANISLVKNFRHEKLMGVDLNSGVEQTPGMKDLKKIADTLKQLRT